MSPEEREAHMRRMIAHGRKVQEQFKRDREQYDRDSRAMWDFLRRPNWLHHEPTSAKDIWNDIHNGEERCQK